MMIQHDSDSVVRHLATEDPLQALWDSHHYGVSGNRDVRDLHIR